MDELWPKLGFLPVDPNNEGFALVAEFMLNELILKYSESLEKLNLKHLKELFVGGDEDDLWHASRSAMSETPSSRAAVVR